MAITVMEGGTYRMLIKDKRVKSLTPEVGNAVVVVLNDGWAGPGDQQGNTFDNWEAARNWVRKAQEQQNA